ncbi:hypothetical protein M011DRAFT_486254 [Sporormia fimetaria CBS 119925]|uniref:Uncharacterized protein n=1 Tax=Sporormia fimetaria CBS 119925 TaxID=1340428 RepID=A0A6A6VBC6_9PLEO|nr:hypothetical protein M011DRAFT_486254 [Sporormia fimetaria CBS 119925]
MTETNAGGPATPVVGIDDETLTSSAPRNKKRRASRELCRTLETTPPVLTPPQQAQLLGPQSYIHGFFQGLPNPQLILDVDPFKPLKERAENIISMGPKVRIFGDLCQLVQEIKEPALAESASLDLRGYCHAALKSVSTRITWYIYRHREARHPNLRRFSESYYLWDAMVAILDTMSDEERALQRPMIKTH